MHDVTTVDASHHPDLVATDAERLASLRAQRDRFKQERDEARTTLTALYVEWSMYRSVVTQVDAMLGYDPKLHEIERLIGDAVPVCQQGPPEAVGECDRMCCARRNARAVIGGEQGEASPDRPYCFTHGLRTDGRQDPLTGLPLGCGPDCVFEARGGDDDDA